MKLARLSLPILLVFTIFLSLQTSGQRSVVLNMPRYDDELFHFGFVLGLNQSFVSIRPIDDLATRVFGPSYFPESDFLQTPDSGKVLTIQSRPIPGFTISIVGDMRLGEHFNLRFIPSLAFGDRDLLYTIQTFTKGDTTQLDFTKKVPSTYINLPLEIKFKSKRYNNFRVYLMAGVQYTLDLASQAKKREEKNRDQKIVKFNQNDIYLEAGIGFDFYNEWFKMGVELKMMYGLMDNLTREGNIYTESIAGLHSRIFQLSFTFE
ncbi:MAG: porin family protein [bacterium]